MKIGIFQRKKNQYLKMLMDKEEEENIKRCESCLQILDPETPLPSVKLLSTADILKSNFVNEKQAVLNPKVSIDNTLDNPSIDKNAT